MSKEDEATEELIRWTGMKHFERKYMTHTVPLSWSQMFHEIKERGFFAASNESPCSTAKALSLQVCVAAATGTPRAQQRFLKR